MSESGITYWFKKIFTAQTIGIIVAVAALVIAFLEFRRDSGGELDVQFAGINVADNVSYRMIVLAADTVVAVQNPSMWPVFSNPSPRAVKGLQLQYYVMQDGIVLSNSPLWTQMPGQDYIAFRYQEPTVYANSNAEEPFFQMRIKKAESAFSARARATYEGLSRPVSFTVAGDVMYFRQLCNESFGQWRERAEKYLIENNAVGYNLYCYADRSHAEVSGSLKSSSPKSREGKSEAPVDVNSEKTSQLPSDAQTYKDCNGNEIIPELKNLKVEIDNNYNSPKAHLSFDAPGTDVAIVAMFKGLEGPEGQNSISRAWQEQRSSSVKFVPRSIVYKRNLLPDQTELDINLAPNINSYKFAGLLKPEPELSGNVEFRGNTVINTMDKPVNLHIAYKIGDNKYYDFKYLRPEQSWDMSFYLSDKDVTGYTAYESPWLEWFNRLPAWLVGLSFMFFIVLGAGLGFVGYSISEKRGYSEGKQIAIMLLGVSIPIFLFPWLFFGWH